MSAARARVVGITGSMGKTSTKDILAALCAPSARTIAAEASFNNEIGVPLTLCRLEADTEVCVLELAMRGFGQIAELARDRAAADRRRHERRAGPPRAGGFARRRRTGERRADRRAARRRYRDRAAGLPGLPRRHRGRPRRERRQRSSRDGRNVRRRRELQLHRTASGPERRDGARRAGRARAAAS